MCHKGKEGPNFRRTGASIPQEVSGQTSPGRGHLEWEGKGLHRWPRLCRPWPSFGSGVKPGTSLPCLAPVTLQGRETNPWTANSRDGRGRHARVLKSTQKRSALSCYRERDDHGPAHHPAFPSFSEGPRRTPPPPKEDRASTQCSAKLPRQTGLTIQNRTHTNQQ